MSPRKFIQAEQSEQPAPACAIGALASRCLDLELDTWPKPGLVSPHDCGSHDDMDAALLRRSARRLTPFFAQLAQAGAEGAAFERLRQIGLAAELAMLDETGGINTHRGAIFGLGLLCAASGLRGAAMAWRSATLGHIVQSVWGPAIGTVPIRADSHGARASLQYGARGARGEAIGAFPTLYGVGLPAYRGAVARRSDDGQAARVQTVFALIAALTDTNLLHRGGADGLRFARSAAEGWLARGGIHVPDWRPEAVAIHRRFVARRLSPGGAADLLAMTLFVNAVEAR